MRLRRKRRFDERFDAARQTVILQENPTFRKTCQEGQDYTVDVEGYFNNKNPIVLEIGCGKGGFIKQIAGVNPQINFVGVEKISNVLLSAMESCKGIKNIGFINCDAQNLGYYLKKHSIQKIYLNFSCPYPKKTYANRRLTNKKFLEIYKEIGDLNLTIEQKTDDKDFFEYSLEQYALCGYKIEKISYDLHAEKEFTLEKEFCTEFEKKFMQMGKPIYYVMVRV